MCSNGLPGEIRHSKKLHSFLAEPADRSWWGCGEFVSNWKGWGPAQDILEPEAGKKHHKIEGTLKMECEAQSTGLLLLLENEWKLPITPTSAVYFFPSMCPLFGL